MKKAFIIIAISILAFTSTAFAKGGTARPNFNEISLSYGYPTFTDFEATIGMAIGSMILVPLGSKLGSTDTKGAVSLEYMHYTKNGRFAFGGLLSYESIGMTFVSKDDPSKVTSTDNMSFATLMPSAKCVWFNRKHVSMYSRIAAGIMTPTDEVTIGFAFQVDPVGVDFGGERFRGFAQLGLGNVGILQAGIRTNF